MPNLSSRSTRRLLAERSVIFASPSGATELSPDEVSLDDVGQKAFRLAALPPAWTLPFFSISGRLHRDFVAQSRQRKKPLVEWTNLMAEAAKQVGILPHDKVLVRSSGRSEGMKERGKFYSAAGVMGDIEAPLLICLEQLANDSELKGQDIPLLVQRSCSPIKAKGHLSNERHCYEEARDWMGQFDAIETTPLSQFKINLRRWRTNLSPNLSDKLSCDLSMHISEVLRAPADWAWKKQARVHFEWAWDGKFVYLVQADEEIGSYGHDPVEEHTSRTYNATSFTPKVVRAVAEDAARFGKIRNVLTYMKLGLPTAPLYILDDQEIIGRLSKDDVPDGLAADLAALVSGSLVIRTDIATDDLSERQLLGRTNEIRDAEMAASWMVEQSKTLSETRKDCAFVFHNFIPAQSAAFAYADPNLPFVQIVALWGLPEGLYYNSHDQYMVDTLKADISSISASDIPRFRFRERTNFKRFFVSTTEQGSWETLTLRAPYDWKSSLSAEDARQIAFESRRIASSDNQAVSIMWFIGVPREIASRSVIPWYHEPYDLTQNQPSLTTRTKTPFDKCVVVQSTQDVERLKSSSEFTTRQNRIRVQPSEEGLLRDKNTLRMIGKIAREKGATIVLEGAILSHAYYQLLRTGAHVEVVHPFIGFEERHEFDKLVRDRVPQIIRERGERVTTDQLNEEAIIRALRQKLVEEAHEVLDAKDLESVLAELADVKEVIDSLIQHLKASDRDVSEQQAKKRSKLGGFADGIVLVKTETLPPTSGSPKEQPHLDGLMPEEIPAKIIDETEFRSRSDWIEKRPDRRTAPGKVEVRVNVSVPVTKPDWSASTSAEVIKSTDEKLVMGHMKASRRGNQWNFELSVSITDAPPGPPALL